MSNVKLRALDLQRLLVDTLDKLRSGARGSNCGSGDCVLAPD
jgi:hypothetical protein